MLRKAALLVGTMLLGVICLGCGESGPDVATVEGTVKMDGEPLPKATVVFVPENGRPAAAITDQQGRYVLTFTEGREGALPGKNRVMITTHQGPSETETGERIPAVPEVVPMKYNAQTTLEFNVEPGKKNVANFDLESGGPLPPTSDET